MSSASERDDRVILKVGNTVIYDEKDDILAVRYRYLEYESYPRKPLKDMIGGTSRNEEEKNADGTREEEKRQLYVPLSFTFPEETGVADESCGEGGPTLGE